MIRYKLLLIILLVVVLTALSGCASKPKVFSDFDSREDFTQFKTFSWVQKPPMLKAGDYHLSALAEVRMTAAIKGELIMHNYEFVEDPADADFTVLYTMGARDKIVLVEKGTGYYADRVDWGWGSYYYPYFLHFPFGKRPGSSTDLREYPEGTIALDIFNARTKKPIWHTVATKRLSKKDLRSHAKNAEEIAEQLLQHFPNRGCEVEETPECKPFE